MIKVDGLTRVYRADRSERPAVDDISFAVSRGEVLGFLGPNGAGKSTTMKMLTCYLPPTAGRASVAGFDVYENPLLVRRNLGYLPEDTPLYRDMTVFDHLHFAGQVRGMRANERTRRIKEVGSVTGVLSVLGKYIGELSRGYRQRVGLTQAMLHDPPVLILDEPTSGLDPNQIVEIRQLIRELGREKTVILSTHILPEVQATCNRVLIINDGKLVADGKPDELIGHEATNRYRVLVASSDEGVRSKLAGLAGVDTVAVTPSEPGTVQYEITSTGRSDLRPVLFRLAADNDWPLLELDRRQASLEEVFGRLTKTEAAA
jgi:ABC-2 type transport system ATP-binding protein